MTATDELRRLLDERGVEWRDEGYTTTNTAWVADGVVWRGLFRDGCIELVAQLTPEQAVDATLGGGTCRFEWSLADNGWADHTCSECGHRENTDIHVSLGWRFCPNCGRRIEVGA